MIERPELFLIDDDLYWACDSDWDEIDATFADMEELGIANLPYDNIDIAMPCHLDTKDSAVRPGGWMEMYFRFRDGKYSSSEIRTPNVVPDNFEPLPDETPAQAMIRLMARRARAKDTILPNSDSEGLLLWAEDARRLLIVLLGSRNVVKERRKDKLAALGIGKKNGLQRPLYSTRLSLPLDLPPRGARPGIPAGNTARPHLRRGHIRRQRYGPQRKFINRIWIEPCFVNADKEYTSNRRSYNVGLHNVSQMVH